MTASAQLSFGIKTTPVHTSYDDIVRVWREADTVPVIEHAWLWDHMLPLFGPASGPIYEGWTLLAALAAQTERLRMGLLVTSNRVRPPAVLAKIAATTDVISGGRLVMGIGVGGTHQAAGAGGVAGDNPAIAEYAAYGLTLIPAAEGVARLDEACTILRRMWTEDAFDFEGRYYRLKGARCEPKPVQRSGPPILIGGWGDKTLRVVAKHADIWNIPGPPHNAVEYINQRNRILDAHCATIGRDPQDIVRSTQTHVSYDEPAHTRATVRDLIEVGVTHFALNLIMPFPQGVAHWVADEIIAPILADLQGNEERSSQR
jgi:alkanesulfonate monooxygenase SsuD/methylene tetrahydromethanopterin reductase-like flavin-dependent oxidoreductase (luciferase family)